MIKSFRDRGTSDIFDGTDTKAARKVCQRELWPVAGRKLDLLNRVVRLEELNRPLGNRLERLKGDRVGQWSIRINDQYRICFHWEDGNANKVEITDYH